MIKAMGAAPALMKMPDVLRPNFSFFPTKWSELRLEKVELLRERFKKEPFAAYIFKDSKLEDDHLALIKKSHLEGLIKVNEDLRSGEAAIKESVEGVFHAVEVLLAAIETQNSAFKDNVLIEKAVEGVKFQFKGVFKSTVVFANSPENKKSSALSKKERDLFKELSDGEED